MADGAPPCRFFAQGNCRAGDQCRFSHAVGQAAPEPARIAAPCRFFLSGGCRAGDSCRFSHDMPAQGVPAPFTKQASVPALPEVRGPLYSLDVECVATGTQHHDRSVAQVGLVDDQCRHVLNVYVKPTKPVVSYLTPLTGISAEHIEKHGVTLEAALEQLRAALPKDATLVGQNILTDVQWLGLKEGVDFAGLIDLVALFRVPTGGGQYAYFSQDHVARVWLRGTPYARGADAAHDAVDDAATSMALFHAFRKAVDAPEQLAALQRATLDEPKVPSFAVANPVFEGVCQGNRKTCVCGAPFF
mmetsp:Transcript_12810/g.43377  ORF Transcript_12810/g.43377 Transcript_12810/m.43377 type:complete len:302 (+) Transcript_12810:98-1003(+)